MKIGTQDVNPEQNQKHAKLIEALELIDHDSIIHLINQGLEIECMKYSVDGCEESRNHINEGNVLLSFLHIKRLGI